MIGVSTFGSESDSTITLALQRFGMTRADVNVKEYGGGSQRLAAVKSGEIKATAINEPTTSQAREQGVHVLIDLAAEQIPWLFSGVVVRRGDLGAAARPHERFLKAVIEGNYLALTNAERAKEVLAQGAEAHRSQDHRHQLRGFQGAVAAQHGAVDEGRGERPRPDRRRRQPQPRGLHGHEP